MAGMQQILKIMVRIITKETERKIDTEKVRWLKIDNKLKMDR